MRNVVALVPARSGSKRIVDKNIMRLNKHPLIAYSIRAAIDSGIFDRVVCVTDSADYANIARYYGADVPRLRPAEISGDRSFDIEWVQWILTTLMADGTAFDAFSILRPTSPFRLPSTIQRAWKTFKDDNTADSLRAIQKVTEHPGKMWVKDGVRIFPLVPFKSNGVPWHSSQYSSLPEVFVQNASLEIARTHVALQGGSIAGQAVLPFVSEGEEGFDINTQHDWILAEYLVRTGQGQLPHIGIQPFHNT